MSVESENIATHNEENKSNSDQNENPSNGLENFSLNEEETPELFNSENGVLNDDTVHLQNPIVFRGRRRFRNPSIFEKTKKLMFFKKINECHHKSGKKTFSSFAK